MDARESIAVALVGILVLLLVGLALGVRANLSVYDSGDLCLQRGFDGWSKINGEVVCVRGNENSAEVRTSSWVEQHCNNQGICVNDNGEVVSTPDDYNEGE